MGGGELMAAHVFVANEVTTAANLNSLLPPVVTQAGITRITPVANTPTAIWVPFPSKFVSLPRVFVTAQTIVPGSSVECVTVTGTTVEGFNALIYRVNNTPTSISWQAWAPVSGAFVDGEPAYASLLSMASKAMRPQRGAATVTPVANTPTGLDVTFATPFSTIPSVIVCANTAVPGNTVKMPSATNISTTGFRVYVYRTSTTATTVDWIALGRI